MSQTYNIQGQITVTNNNIRNIVSLAEANTTTSSTVIVNNASIPTGSWVAIDSGSNTTFRFGYFCNTNLSSSVKIAVGGTGSNASILTPGDFCMLTYDSAVAIYAFATGSVSPVILQYIYAGI